MIEQEPCAEEVCVTCADTAVPGTLIRPLDGDLAVVDVGGSYEEVSVALVDAAVGDTVLIHAREAIAVVTGADRSEVAGENDHGRG